MAYLLIKALKNIDLCWAMVAPLWKWVIFRTTIIIKNWDILSKSNLMLVHICVNFACNIIKFVASFHYSLNIFIQWKRYLVNSQLCQMSKSKTAVLWMIFRKKELNMMQFRHHEVNFEVKCDCDENSSKCP